MILIIYFSIFDFNSTPCFDSELLKVKYPFVDDPDSRHLLLNPDIDPDSNIFDNNSNVLSNCIYLTSKEFNNIPFPSPIDSFSLFHINIRSLKKHSDDLAEFLSTLDTSFSTIGITETWLDNSTKDLYNIPGYTFLASSRQHKIGGAVGLYIKSNLSMKPRTDLQSSDTTVYEPIFVLFHPSRKKKLVLITFMLT